MYCLKPSKHEYSLSIPKLPFLLDAPTYMNLKIYTTACSKFIQSFQSFSLNWTSHTAIIHIISVLQQYGVSPDYASKIHVRLQPSNTVIYHVSDCSVQCGIGTKYSERTVTRAYIIRARSLAERSGQSEVCICLRVQKGCARAHSKHMYASGWPNVSTWAYAYLTLACMYSYICRYFWVIFRWKQWVQ